jgi:hypothetical protein
MNDPLDGVHPNERIVTFALLHPSWSGADTRGHPARAAAFPLSRVHAITAMRRLLVAACLIVGTGVNTVRAQDYKIVVNEANPVSELSRADVAQLFLKKKTAWPSGQAVVPVDQSSGRARAAFSQEVLEKDLASMRRYWQQLVFSGRASAPEEKPSDAAVVAYVRDTPGAIGYVSGSAPTAGVKPIVVR